MPRLRWPHSSDVSEGDGSHAREIESGRQAMTMANGKGTETALAANCTGLPAGVQLALSP